jgi:hypothetical protein
MRIVISGFLCLMLVLSVGRTCRKAFSQARQPSAAEILERPVNGVTHPDVDAAWKVFRDEVDEAIGALASELEHQVAVARSSGDLDDADILQGMARGIAAGEPVCGVRFRLMEKLKGKQYKRRAAKSLEEAERSCTRAVETLGAVYQSLSDRLTKDITVDLAEPKAVLHEWEELNDNYVAMCPQLRTMSRRELDQLLEVSDGGKFGSSEWTTWNEDPAYRAQNFGVPFQVTDSNVPKAATAFGKEHVLFVHPKAEGATAEVVFDRITKAEKGKLILFYRNQPLDFQRGGMRGLVGANILAVQVGAGQPDSVQSMTRLWQRVSIPFDYEKVRFQVKDNGDWNAEGCFITYEVEFSR